jgi:hypothetical protein
MFESRSQATTSEAIEDFMCAEVQWFEEFAGPWKCYSYRIYELQLFSKPNYVSKSLSGH